MVPALIASLFSIWLRISTALSEIVAGTIAQLIIGAAIGSANASKRKPPIPMDDAKQRMRAAAARDWEKGTQGVKLQQVRFCLLETSIT